MAKRQPEPPPIEPREFRSPEEIDAAIVKLRRQIDELGKLDIRATVMTWSGKDQMIQNNVRASIREVFGPTSLEFREHQYIDIWAGELYEDRSPEGLIAALQRGRLQVTSILEGLIRGLEEKRTDLIRAVSAPATYFNRLNLHPRILAVSKDRFHDGYPWDAVFAASKALVKLVKERSNRYDLDGAPLMRAVFSKNAPILAFNELKDQTDLDEQEGMMHLFEAAVQAIRNPGGHDFPEGPEQRAMEYISFLSLLAYRLEEAKRRK